MSKKAKLNQWVTLLIGLIAVLIAGSLIFHKSINPPNYNVVTDTANGISFNMSKDFQPISRDELASMNSGFSYGFRPSTDKNALCIISQTKLAGGGVTTGIQLRDELLNELKKVHPNVVLTNPATATNTTIFGSAKGVLLQLAYSDGQNKIERVEIVGLGKTSQVIAYCQSLAADSTKYYDDFTVFFSSLKLIN